MSKSLLEDAFGHHVWATVRLINACLPLSDEQLDTPVPGTFGSILETMRHLVDADSWYLFRLSGDTVPEVDTSEMDMAQLLSTIEGQGAGWSDVLAGKPDPDALVAGQGDDGSVEYWPKGIRIAQVVHHGTDHRSQICTALTTLGEEPPAIDVWDFGWETGRMVRDSAEAKT